MYPSVDPCYNYIVLDNPWRANSSQPSNLFMMCDQSVTWSGWYRLFINGLNAQIPDTCVSQYSCGTHIALWIHSRHPKVEDGVVTRDVCGHADSYCCYYGSYPIKVKACPGHYYVYELVSPTLSYAAYCAGNYIHMSTFLGIVMCLSLCLCLCLRMKNRVNFRVNIIFYSLQSMKAFGYSWDIASELKFKQEWMNANVMIMFCNTEQGCSSI